jgi:catechol-2,3-dioxygenase
MSQDPIRFLGRLILCLAGCASYVFVGPISVFGEYTKSHASPPPKIDHILLEVSNLAVSIRFYRDFLGLHLKSRIFGFAMLESGNVGVFLWSHHWNWEKPRSSGERRGLGIYPHLEVGDAAEAFVADPDGYIWAFVSPPK